MFFCINDSCWHHYPQDQLFDLMEEHKLLFPDFVRPKGKYIPNYRLVARAGEPYTDDLWLCLDNHRKRNNRHGNRTSSKRLGSLQNLSAS